MDTFDTSTTTDKPLFTPGPLTTSAHVKQAMLRDLGSRDAAFLGVVRDIRQRLAALAGGAGGEYTAIIMQGSGTFGVESVVGSVIPPDGKLLVLANGAYGRRIVQMARVLRIAVESLEWPENQVPDLNAIDQKLAADSRITHVAVVHCETTSGIVNPVVAIGTLARAYGKKYIVDAMSSFGAIPLDLGGASVDYLISSANKCLEGVPGFSFVLARRSSLAATEGYARSLSLDLLAQWRELERSGQFRFTPPTHVLLAFHHALAELDAEGGIAGRAARYRANHATLAAGMRALGFRAYLAPEQQSAIITSYHYPTHPAFLFEAFYERLNQKGFVIYPGKLSDAPCFRIGTIGRIFPHNVRALLAAIRETIDELGIVMGA